MNSLKFVIALALASVFGVAQARGAAALLPPDVIASDTIAVIRADSAHFTPDQLQASMKMLLEDEAKEVDEPLAKFKEMFDKATTRGVDALTMVIGAAKKDDPDARRGTAILYVTLKPNADVEAIEKLVTDKMLERGDQRDIVFEHADNFLAMHAKTQEFPVKPDHAREALFAEALKTVANASLQVALIPDEASRETMRHSADDGNPEKDIRPKLAKARWMSLGVVLGSSPRITAIANLATETDAKAITQVIKADLDDIKTEITKPGPLVLVAPTIQKVIDGLEITQTDTHASVSINADSLKLLANLAATTGVFERR